MKAWFGRMAAAGAVALALTGAPVMAAGKAPAPCGVMPAADKVVALNEIQNLMGRYDHQGTLRGEGTLADLFALNTEGVSWLTPGGPVGLEAMRARFADPDEDRRPGILHMHSMFSPVIEVAGDGQTAKGVWDSFGPSINGPDDIGAWLWVKYAVDFVKEQGKWKIWHLQVFPVFNTKFSTPITQTARDMAARQPAAEVAGVSGRDSARAGANPMQARPGYAMPAKLWRYDGKSTPQGPFIPVAYCHFDAATAYTIAAPAK